MVSTPDSLLERLSIDDIDALMTELEKRKDNIKKNNKTSIVTLNKFYQEYSNHSSGLYSTKYQKSIKESFKHLITLFGEKNIAEFCVKDVDSLIEAMKKTAPRGYRVYFRTLKAAFSKAVDWNYLKENPFFKVRLTKDQSENTVYLIEEEVKLILDHTTNTTHKDIFIFAFNTGCRISEILNLKWTNVHFDKGYFAVGDSEFMTKSRKIRNVPMCKKVEQLLKRLYKNSVNKNGYIFAKKGGFKYTADYISKRFKFALRQTLLNERLHFHSLRHSFASKLVQCKTDLYIVRDLLGHSSIKTTERYSHLELDNLKKAIAVFDKAA